MPIQMLSKKELENLPGSSGQGVRGLPAPSEGGGWRAPDRLRRGNEPPDSEEPIEDGSEGHEANNHIPPKPGNGGRLPGEGVGISCSH